jgi:two-component system LytT family sensor kinase
MASLTFSPPRPRVHDLQLAIKSIAGFWLFYFLTFLARSLVLGDGWTAMFTHRTAGILVGIVLTFLVYLALRLFAERGSLRRMIIVGAIACLPASIAFSALNFTTNLMSNPMFQQDVTREMKDGTVITQTTAGQLKVQRRGASSPIVIPVPSAREAIMGEAPRYIAEGAVTWYFFFAAWSAFYVAMSSANQLRLAERRAAEFERAAQSAQLRALRYQVNPHFLFNTLNSLSSLVMARREEEAERMIMNLSNFFRSTLSIDPAADVSLSEEIALQMLYLDIEKSRFPKRLQVKVVIPQRLQSARIPALLLQPVVENAIKYGVARAKNVVSLVISAEEYESGMLRVTIENSGGPEAAPDAFPDGGPSTGVGLTNVAQRLAARFGEAASCEFGPRPEGGFRVVLTMPLVTHV